MIVDRTMRWLERRSRFVELTTFIDPRRYSTDIIDNARAARFIDRHHYLRSMPVTQLCVGLFGPRSGRTRPPLVGTAIFAVPSTPAVITAHTGLEPGEGTTLARFILLDEVPANAETHFLSRAHRHLRHERATIHAVVSYADPMAGHIGHAYCAASARHRGTTKPRTSWSIGGQTIPGRTLSKIRRGDNGHASAIDRIVELGAQPPRHGELPSDWLKRLQDTGELLRGVHPGYFVYAFPLTRRARSRAQGLAEAPYPNLTDNPLPAKEPVA